MIKKTNSSTQQIIYHTKEIQTNDYSEDKLTKIDKNSIRVYYMNTNGIYSRNGNHTMLQLCHNLNKVGVNIIGLTETNVH